MQIIMVMFITLVAFWGGTQLDQHNTEEAGREHFDMGFDYADMLCGDTDRRIDGDG